MNVVKIIALCAFTLVFYIAINVATRPDYISVPVELPKRKPVTAIYEFGPDEDFPEPFTRPAYQDTDIIADVVDYEPTPQYTEEDLNCLALNIYFEAYEESIKGQLAVGLVTLNRVKSPYFPNTVCGVVYQHKQFSWYWDGKSDRPRYIKKYQTARLLASSLLHPESKIYDYTYGSDHYHADYVDPYWRDGMIRVVKIDTHIFYRDPTLNVSL
jgi:spore germination cell wall hydrolase CwlJ-like protein